MNAATMPPALCAGAVPSRFVDIVLAQARLVGMPMTADGVVSTFSCLNEKARVATLCFRLKSERSGAGRLAPAFKGFKQTFQAVLEGEHNAIDIHCHLSGVVDERGQLFDWSGQPTDAMG